jgi:hypothetical protein
MPSQLGPRGYFRSDHRQGGVGPDGERGVLLEQDFVTCSHCDRIVYLVAWNLKGGFCLRCSKRVCDACAFRGTCTPRPMRQDARR